MTTERAIEVLGWIAEQGNIYARGDDITAPTRNEMDEALGFAISVLTQGMQGEIERNNMLAEMAQRFGKLIAEIPTPEPKKLSDIVKEAKEIVELVGTMPQSELKFSFESKGINFSGRLTNPNLIGEVVKLYSQASWTAK